MHQKIQLLLAQITALEDDLRSALREQETQLFYQVNGKRVEFEETIRKTHQKIKRGLWRWIVTDRPQNFFTGPIIYSMIIPMLLLDLSVTLYQTLCFPIYRIAKVRRVDYLVDDRKHLGYLNIVERFHCTYCSYGSGLLAYTAEIVARTEQYFCPIKHARKVLHAHSRYKTFLAFGDGEHYHARLEEFRNSLDQEIPR